jgi:hypothetical protein
MAYITPQEAISMIAARARLSEEAATALCQALTELAVEKAADGFPVPGLGVLTVKAFPERKFVFEFGP